MTRLRDRIVWFDYDALKPYSEDDVGLFCLSDRDISIILSCLRYTTWSARWYDSEGNRLRDVGRDDDLADAIEKSERLIGRLMSDSCSDLQNTFDALIDALGAVGGGGCGCGAGGAGSTDDPPSSSDWGDVNDPLDPGTPPDGFDTWEEYKSYKCDVATWILDNVISDIQWIKTLDIAALTVAGLAFGLLTPIPGDALFALLAGLIASLAISTGFATVLEDALTNGYEDILCALYTGENAAESKANAQTEIDTAIDAETANVALRAMLKLTVAFWVNYVGINKMFDRDVVFESQLPTGDCSACGVPQWWLCSTGGVTDWGEDYVEIQSVLLGDGVYWVSVGDDTGPGLSATVIDGAWTAPGVVPAFATAEEDVPRSVNVGCGSGDQADWDFTSAGFDGGPWSNAGVLQFRSGSDIKVRFEKLS